MAAGHAPLFGERSLDDAEMGPVQEALERVLARPTSPTRPSCWIAANGAPIVEV
jgi:hypothetical protein